jgi:ribonuclease HI
VCVWRGPSLEQAWKDWLQVPKFKKIKALPLLVSWGIWLARNSTIFKDKASIPEIIAAQGLSILSHFPQEKDIPAICINLPELIDSSNPWAYFDGASQNQLCGGGVVLFLSDNHFYKIKMGLGQGTNNYVELMALKLLLQFVGEKGVQSIQIFGDSMNVINWSRKTQTCHNIFLLPIVEEIFILLDSFESFSLRHVYRDQNSVADSLSKAGIQLTFGQWHITESDGEDFFEYYHHPFIDGPAQAQ